jgi:hypothetical protein
MSYSVAGSAVNMSISQSLERFEEPSASLLLIDESENNLSERSGGLHVFTGVTQRAMRMIVPVAQQLVVTKYPLYAGKGREIQSALDSSGAQEGMMIELEKYWEELAASGKYCGLNQDIP